MNFLNIILVSIFIAYITEKYMWYSGSKIINKLRKKLFKISVFNCPFCIILVLAILFTVFDKKTILRGSSDVFKGVLIAVLIAFLSEILFGVLNDYYMCSIRRITFENGLHKEEDS